MRGGGGGLLMYTSPSAVRPLRNSFTFSGSAFTFLPSASFELPSSSGWKRRFSSSTTAPPLAPLTAFSTALPTQSSTNVTFCVLPPPPSSFSSSGTTGRRLYLSTRLPSGRPRCDMSTTALAPCSMAYLMVGMAPTMR